MDTHALLAAFLRHHADPEGGLALYGLFAPDSPLPFCQAVTPAGAIAAEDFAETHRAIFDPPEPLPRFELLALERETEENGVRLAWLRVREAESGLDYALGCGLHQVEGDWRIGWLTLARAPEPWGDGLGEAQTVADWPYRGAIAPRSWLDLAHRRLDGHEKPPLTWLPEARFSCHSHSACCRVDYVVEVAPAFQRVIDAIPWADTRPELQGLTLPVVNGRLQIKADGGPCVFLDSERKCSVHKALGRAVFPPCARFPFTFVETPDGVAVSASAVCHSVRGNLGLPLDARRDDLHQRLAIAREAVFKPEAFRLRQGQDVPWEAYREAESALLRMLARDELPIERRLFLASALLANWDKGFRAVPAEIEAMPIPVAPEGERASMDVLLADFLLYLGIVAPAPVARGGRLAGERQLTAMLRQMLFSKLLAGSFDLATAQNLGVLLYLLVLHVEALSPGGPTDAQWEALARMFMHGGVLHVLAGEGARQYREMFADPEFGLWLLTYPAEAPCVAS